MAGFACTTSIAYRVVLARSGNKYTCSVAADGGNLHAANALSGSSVPRGNAAIATCGAQWLMIVTSS